MLRAPLSARGAWSHWIPVFVLVLVGITLLWRDPALGMVTIWARSGTFMHAFLVPPIVVWLVWSRRAALAPLAPAPSAWGLLPAAAAALLWLAGALAAVDAAMQFAYVAFLVAAAAALLGPALARRVAFPLAFLFFMVPIGEFMLPALMRWTADFTVLALRLSGIPVFREGQQMVLPSGHWSVVEACSGLRYLIASVMVGVLFAFTTFRSARRRIAFVAVAVAVPLVANWVRAYAIVLLGHLSDHRVAVGVDHLIYGWVFFGVVMVLMFAIGARWSDDVDEEEAAPASIPAAPRRSPGPATPWPVAAALLVLAALPLLALQAIEADTRAGTPLLLAPPAQPGWVAEPGVPEWQPVAAAPTARVQQTYAFGARRVALDIAYYRQQSAGRKLVGSDNVLVRSDDPLWLVASEGRAGVPGAASVRTARLARVSGAEPGLAVWRLWWVDGMLTASERSAKLRGAWARLAGRGDDGAVIVLSTPDDAPQASQAALAAFLAGHLGVIETSLQQAYNTVQLSQGKK